MDEADKPSRDLWPREAATRPDLPALKGETSKYVMEIRGASDIVLRSHSADSEEPDSERIVSGLGEALRLLSGPHIATERTRIKLILCMKEPYAPEPIVTFLKDLQELEHKPEVTLSNCNAPQDIEELVDRIESAPHQIELLDAAPPSSRQALPSKTGEKYVEVSMERYESAKLSPLPALQLEQFREMTHNPDLTRQPKHPDIHVVSAIDFDGSIYENNPEHGIVLLDLMRFVKARNTNGFNKGWGNLNNLDEAIAFCEQWAKEREARSRFFKVADAIKYKNGIIKSNTQSAAAFQGMPLQHLRELADEFVETGMKGRFYGHLPLVLKKYHDYGVLPFLVTGMPHVLVSPICKKMHEKLGIGITHGNGLLYQLEGEGNDRRLTGNVEHYKNALDIEVPLHMGNPDAKARTCSNVIDVGYGLIGSLGDSQGDLGIWSSSIRRMRGIKWDWDGGAVLLDAEGEAGEDVGDNYSLDVEAKHFMVLNRKKSSAQDVHDAVEKTLESVFKADIRNIENIKRIRDILTGLGFPDEEKREIMSVHYPTEIVDAALKDHNVNTKNENDFVRHLRRIGATDEEITSLLGKNRHYYQKRNITMVPLRKRSTFPPPPLPKESETSDDIKR